MENKATTRYIEETVYDLPPQRGKVWRRKSDGVTFECVEKLGKLFYLGDKKLKTPIQEKPEDFELVNMPKE